MKEEATYRYGNEKTGYAKVTIRHPAHKENPTPEDWEEVRKNRENLERSLSLLNSQVFGTPVQVTVDWDRDCLEK